MLSSQKKKYNHTGAPNALQQTTQHLAGSDADVLLPSMETWHMDDFLCSLGSSGDAAWKYWRAGVPGWVGVGGERLVPFFSLASLMEKSEKMNFK